MVVFIKPRDLKVINTEDLIILRRGIINISEVEINKGRSTRNFLDKFQEFIANRRLELSESSEIMEDFDKLARMGLINRGYDKSQKVLFLVNSSDFDYYKEYLSPKYEVENIDSLLSIEEAELIVQDKNVLEINSLLEKFSRIFKPYSWIYFIDSTYHLSKIKAFNYLICKLNKLSTFAIVDNENLYLFGVEYRKTGCFECLEKHILTKFDIAEQELNVADNIDRDFDLVSSSIILGLLLRDLKNINLFGQSQLIGNYLHFYLPTFDYEFNINRIATSCKVCSTINNTNFKEQNMNSINILKGLRNGDFDIK
ncbi:hypothetical protein HCZ80_09680 [Limosilactobacillus fermentum]|uniref:hypothetical protein n=1 Tax=Limosilactobacillus fermentum TaxID=1613 RepID=UPI0030EFD28D